MLQQFLPYLVWGYVATVTLIGFATMGVDKRLAVVGRRRISERALLTWAILGGSVGSLLGMAVFHHKTRHTKFKVGLPVILIVQLAAAAAVLWWLYVAKP